MVLTATSTLSHERDVFRVATKSFDILLEPEECCPLVTQPIIGLIAVLDKLTGSQEAKRSQAITLRTCQINEISPLSQGATVESMHT